MADIRWRGRHGRLRLAAAIGTPEPTGGVAARSPGYSQGMHPVPERFWLVGDQPRPVTVTSVTPSTIYLAMGDEVLELDRAAFVDAGEIRVAGDSAGASQLAVSEDDARRRSRDAAASQMEAVEHRIGKMRDAMAELKEQLDAEKRTRKRLRRAAREA